MICVTPLFFCLLGGLLHLAGTPSLVLSEVVPAWHRFCEGLGGCRRACFFIVHCPYASNKALLLIILLFIGTPVTPVAGQWSKFGVTSNPPEGVAGQLDKDILHTNELLFTSSSHFKGRESYPRVPPLPYSTCRTRGISTHEGPWIPSLPSRRHL